MKIRDRRRAVHRLMNYPLWGASRANWHFWQGAKWTRRQLARLIERAAKEYVIEMRFNSIRITLPARSDSC